MNKKNQKVLEAVERIVFGSRTPVVVALTGGWGEGKTYFWKTHVVPKHKASNPGYVSVFGADSLAAIRERVVLATTPVAENQNILKKMSAGIGKWGRAAINALGERYAISDSIAVELLQSFMLKPGWVVCIDDVERLSDEVGFETFLGYISELRDKWEISVVLIYNREPIDKDSTNAFHAYQEKVIDRVIPFSLDFDEIVSLVFRDEHSAGFDVAETVRVRAAILGLRNIRLLVKTRVYFDEVMQILGPGASAEFLRTALGSILLFVYTKFSNQKPEGLTFDLLASYSGSLDRARELAGILDADEEDQAKDVVKELLHRYEYTSTDDLDQLLMAFVMNDLLDAEQLHEIYAVFSKNKLKGELDKNLQAVWDTHFHGRLGDNSREFCDAIEQAVPPFLPFISPGELDFALLVLSTFGRAEEAQKLFDEFRRLRGSVFENLSANSLPHGTYKYAPLKDYIDGIRAARQTDTRTLAQVLADAFDSDFVRSADGARIAASSVDELLAYFVENPQPHLNGKLQTLAKSPDEAVRRMAFEVAEKIAERGTLDRMRMDGQGLLRRQKPPDQKSHAG